VAGKKLPGVRSDFLFSGAKVGVILIKKSLFQLDL